LVCSVAFVSDDRKKGAGRWEALDFGFEFHTPFEDEFE
jgi:hypothetical protein